MRSFFFFLDQARLGQPWRRRGLGLKMALLLVEDPAEAPARRSEASDRAACVLYPSLGGHLSQTRGLRSVSVPREQAFLIRRTSGSRSRGPLRQLRVPWTARRSNQFILKEINPGISLK